MLLRRSRKRRRRDISINSGKDNLTSSVRSAMCDGEEHAAPDGAKSLDVRRVL